MGKHGTNLADFERNANYKIKIITNPKGSGRGDYVSIRGEPPDVEYWARKVMEDYGVGAGQGKAKYNHNWQSDWHNWQYDWQGWQYDQSWQYRSQSSQGGKGYSKRDW